jgi:hypothetical protein
MNTKQILFGFTLVTLLWSAGEVQAQTTQVEKALEGVKQTVDDLVSAKDDKNPQELSLRIQTFRKVLDLAIAEAKDLKIRLISEEPAEEDKAATLHEELVKNVSDALKFYEEKLKKFSLLEKDLNLEDIRLIAEDFQKQREANFSIPTQTAHDFLASRQTAKILEIARTRYEKINNDLKKMGRNRTTDSLISLLKTADKNLKTAEENARLATEKFEQDYLLPKEIAVTEELSLNTIVILEEEKIEETSPTSTPSSTDAQVPAPVPPPSIRDLVQASLTSVKDAYQVFIEMSAVVRKASIR